MQQRYSKVLAGLAMATLLVPVAASAQTSDSVSAQIQSIVAQIQALQLQLRTLLASSTPVMRVEQKVEDSDRTMPGQVGKAMCVALNRNLRVGSQGDDVKKLQEMLSQDPSSGFRGQATGFFGPLTANAIAQFQLHMGIASTTDGTVGPLTRGFFDRACGKGLNNTPGSAMGPMMMDMHAAEVGGTITDVSATSVTVQSNNGTTRIVNITDSTKIIVLDAAGVPTTGTSASLTVGASVRVVGSAGADNSLTAREIRMIGGGAGQE